jgi:ubiquinone/menaquinone biosynthesis C-methylase UbiE
MLSHNEIANEAIRYGSLASEYYDPVAHPTCKNFRDASGIFLSKVFNNIEISGAIVDVGAGASIVAEIFAATDLPLNDLLLVDSSEAMLEHSRQHLASGVSLLVSDARALPFRAESVGLLVASLGDPFNVGSFWREVARCLRRDGKCLFTTPSYEWARSFRGSARNEREAYAYFELQDGQRVYVPSIIHPIAEQLEICSSYGLRTTLVEAISSADLPDGLSPKLRTNGVPHSHVVTGYCLVRS